MNHVFLSYARTDRERARRVAGALEAEGIRVWWDQELHAGEEFAQVIQTSLTTASAVIVLWSRASVQSKWVYAEAEFAERWNRLVPAVIEPSEPPLPFNCLDTAMIHDWDGKADHPEFQRILDAVRAAMAHPPMPAVLSSEEHAFHAEHDSAPPTAPAAHERRQLEHRLKELEAGSAKLLSLGDTDEHLVRLGDFANELIRFVEEFPSEAILLRDLIFDWQSASQSWSTSAGTPLGRRVLEERRKRLRQVLKESAGEIWTTNPEWMERLPQLADYGPWRSEVYIKKLTSEDELDRTDAVDHLAACTFDQIREVFAAIAESPSRPALLERIWENWPRIRLFHHKAQTFLSQLAERIDPEPWRRRMATFHLLQTVEHADDVNLILGRASPEDRAVFFESMLVHPVLNCRKFALERVPVARRWNTLVFGGVHIVILRELIVQSCEDCEDEYIKVMFLLTLPRLMREKSAIGIREAYTMMTAFYGVPLFLQDTFFGKLVELHAHLRRRVTGNEALEHLEKQNSTYFKAFCSKERLRDVDITRMTHVPLPIQRMMAHEGHFPGYFICNYRDPIALETVPHVQRRPDAVEFLRLKRINAQALEKLASDRLFMREYIRKLTFCRNPKAKQKQLIEHLQFLRRTDLKALTNDKNASSFAREHATRIVSRAV